MAQATQILECLLEFIRAVEGDEVEADIAPEAEPNEFYGLPFLGRAPFDLGEVPEVPLTPKGKTIMAKMMQTYRDPEKAKRVFYASENAGKIKAVHKKTLLGRR